MKKLFHQLRRRLAKLWLEINLQLEVIGITGSYGKTTAVYATASVLSSQYSVNRTDLNLDTIYNLPITILKTKLWNEILVLEYGVDHRREMDFHLSLVKPKIAVLTGITPVHSDPELLGSLKNIIAEKKKLVEAVPAEGLAVFNWDDEWVRKIGQEHHGRKVFYGLNKDADVWAEEIKITPEGTNFILHDGQLVLSFKTGLLGYPAVYACLVAYIIGREKKVEVKNIQQKLAELKPLAGRLSLEAGPLGTVLLNDAKRANPASVLAGLKTLTEFPGRKVVVLGEMGELGEMSKILHRQVGEKIAQMKIDYLVGVGPLTRLVLAAAEKKGMPKKRLLWAADVGEAAEILRPLLQPGDLLYLKASLLRHLERVILLLNGQKVTCKEVVCHNYKPCSDCSRL